MKIIAHRGYWNHEIQNNSPAALRLALERGYGIESDLRDYQGELVISHNIADANSQHAAELFHWLAEFEDQCCFAINIKADGLKDLLRQQLAEHQLKNYFTFDMSIPQTIEYAECGIRFFTRQSEVEPTPPMYEKAAGVWVDGFWDENWINEELLQGHLRHHKLICLVSPDLHQREYRPFWEKLLHFNVDFRNIMLCTDHPDEAKAFFSQVIEK